MCGCSPWRGSLRRGYSALRLTARSPLENGEVDSAQNNTPKFRALAEDHRVELHFPAKKRARGRKMGDARAGSEPHGPHRSSSYKAGKAVFEERRRSSPFFTVWPIEDRAALRKRSFARSRLRCYTYKQISSFREDMRGLPELNEAMQCRVIVARRSFAVGWVVGAKLVFS